MNNLDDNGEAVPKSDSTAQDTASLDIQASDSTSSATPPPAETTSGLAGQQPGDTMSAELEFVLNAVAGNSMGGGVDGALESMGTASDETTSSSGGGGSGLENNPSPSDDLSPLLSSSLNMASRAGSEGRSVINILFSRFLHMFKISVAKIPEFLIMLN